MARHRPDFSHSLTDLMASVAVMFLLIAAIFIVKSAEASQKEREANKKKIESIDTVEATQKESKAKLEELFKSLSQDHSLASVARVTKDLSDPFLLTITYRSDQLTFATDRSDLNEAARHVIAASFPVLIRGVCSQETGRIESVTVEGHSDAQGGGEKFQYNYELSARRALSVFAEGRQTVAHFRQLPPEKLNEMLRCVSEFTVAGRGPVQPTDRQVAWDNWDARRGSKPEDRRVEIKVRFSAGEKQVRKLEASREQR